MDAPETPRRLLADRSVTAKIGAALLAASAVAVGVGAVGVSGMSSLDAELKTVKAQHVDGMRHISDVRAGLTAMYRADMLHSLGVPEIEGVTPLEAARAADAQVAESLDRYAAGASGSATTQAVEDLRSSYEDYATLRDVVLFQQTPPAGFTMPVGEQIAVSFGDAEDGFNTAITALQDAETQQAQARSDEAAATYRTARATVVAALVAGLALAGALAAFVVRTISRQLRSVGTALDAVAAGDLTVAADVHSRDELGAMAGAVNRARTGIGSLVRQLTESTGTLDHSSRQLTGVTQRIAGSAQEAAAQADVVAASAADISASVRTVADGASEMGLSIREISQNANDAARVAQEAVEVASATNVTVSKLGESSAQIGNVVKVITAIAEQTNLLALNATIEAARAGEMGKGFAVVAGEVKELAQQTAAATEDISRRVATIQADTEGAVRAIADITRIVGTISDYQGTIASAVEEQTATTAAMSSSVGEAAAGAAGIAGSIGGVAGATRTTTTSLAEGETAVLELAATSSRLQELVGRFRV
ncbi:methyl-accepting chemotaxis protein [Kineococcus sp. SYSU DK018]|uniref:methyl-accepting chemotaxis protein n=1 Tax=Kineococcus sp. SYSU DK018 TaxID=3383139 RepID=UPI003D7CA29A